MEVGCTSWAFDETCEIYQVEERWDEADYGLEAKDKHVYDEEEGPDEDAEEHAAPKY